jgi:hypothetical protein
MSGPNLSPIYPVTPNVGQGTLSGANTARDGTGSNLSTALTAGANGTQIRGIHFHATAAVSAAVITIFLKISSTYTLIGEVVVAPLGTTTPGNTSVAWAADWLPGVVDVIPSGAEIVIGQTINQAIAFTVASGDY